MTVKKVKNIGRLLNMPSDPRSFGDADPSKLALNKCYVGVEVEVEGATKLPEFEEDTGTQFWKTHEDGSLRNKGIEFVFVEPLRGADIVTAIEGLCSEAKRLKYVTSDRTGIHVHIDIRNLTPDQLHAMCLVYAIFEKALFHYIAPDRYVSNFCVPWGEAGGSLMELGQLLHSSSDNGKVHAFQAQHKYSALNIESANRLGTVEFRHMHTTFDAEAILTWVNICLSIKKFALRYNGGPRDFIMMFSNGPERLCETVFERYAPLLLRTPDFKREAYKGMRLSLDMMVDFRQAYEEYVRMKGAGLGVGDKYQGKEGWQLDTTSQRRMEGMLKSIIPKRKPKTGEEAAADLVANAMVERDMVQPRPAGLRWQVNPTPRPVRRPVARPMDPDAPPEPEEF